MVYLFKELFKIIDIYIPIKEIRKECDYYNQESMLKNISESLSKWNIRSLIVQLNSKHLKKIPLPAIIIRRNDNNPLILKKINKNTLFIFDAFSKVDEVIEIENFEKRYLDKVLLLEKLNQKYKVQNKVVLFNKYYLFLFLFVMLFLTFNIFVSYEVGVIIIIKITSLILLSAYFLNEKRINNKIYSFICSKKNQSCLEPNNVNNKIFDILSFSEIGIVFNLSTVFSLSFFNFLDKTQPVLEFYVYILGFFGILFSLHTQVYKRKRFCRICITVIIIFILDFLLFNSISLNYYFVPNVIFLLLLIISYFFIEHINQFFNYLNKCNKLERINKQLWRNKTLINNLIVNQPVENFNVENSICFGDKNALKSSVIIVDPMCKHCLKAFTNMIDLVNLNPEYRLNVFIKTSTSAIDLCSFNKLVIASLKNEFEYAKEIFENWFTCKKILKKIEYNSKVISKFEFNNQFFKKNNFDFFPSIYIDGKKIPDFINFEHIKIAYSR